MRKPALAIIRYGLCTLPLFSGLSALNGDTTQLRIQAGHTGPINAVTFQSQKKRVLTVSDDKSVKIWELNGRLNDTLYGHSARISAVAASPVTGDFVTGSADKTARVWKADGNSVPLLGHTDSITDVRYSAQGTWILTVSKDRSVRIWSSAGLHYRDLIWHSDTITSAVFSPDGKSVLTTSWDKKARIWSVADGTAIDLIRHEFPIAHGEFTSDGGKILTSGVDGTVILWDNHGKFLRKIEIPSKLMVKATLAYGGNGILTCSRNGDIAVYSQTGTLVTKFHTGAAVEDCKFMKAGEEVLVRSLSPTLKIYSRRGEKLRSTQPHASSVLGFWLSPDETQILTASYDRTAILTDMRLQKGIEFSGMTNHANQAILLENQNMLLTVSDDSTANVWSWNEKNDQFSLKSLEIHSDMIHWLEYSPSTRSFITASTDFTALITDADNSRKTALKGHEGIVYASTLDRQGKRAITASSDRTAKIWEKNGTLQHTIRHSEVVRYGLFAPDTGSGITAADDFLIRVWDPATFSKETCRLPGHEDKIHALDISPDGAYLVSASYDKTARIWDLRKCGELGIFPFHKETVNSVVFTDKGDQVLSASADGSIMLWDIKTLLPVKKYAAHSGPVHSARFSQSRKFVVSAGWDSTYRLWDAETRLHLATLLRFNDGTGLVYTPDGRFDVTDETAKRYVSYQQRDRYFDLVDIQRRYRVKGLLKKILRGELGKPERRIEQDAEGLPGVNLKSPDAEAVSRIFTASDISDHKFPLVFVPVDNGGGLSTAEIFVDGRLVQTVSNIESGKKIDLEVPLWDGLNRIKINVKNKRGIGAPVSAQIDYRSGQRPRKPILHFLGVGVNKYTPERNELKFAEADVKAVGEALKKYAGALGQNERIYADVKIHSLLGEQAKKVAIKEKIAAITSQASKEDVIMLYFSGHGASAMLPGESKTRFYAFLPIDFSFTSMTYDSLITEGVHSEFLSEQLNLKNTKAKKIVLILDTCHSGDVLDFFATRKSGMESDTAVLSDLVAGSGIFVLASSAGEQVSRESPKLGHGVFTQVFLEGLQNKTADYDKNGIVTIVELGNYLKLNVDTKLKEVFTSAEKQNPRIVELGRDHFSEAYNNFPLANVR